MLHAIDPVDVFEQVHESMEEYFDLIEPNNEVRSSFLVLENHINGKRVQYERAVFACSRLEHELAVDLRVSGQFGAKISKRACQCIRDLQECLSSIRGMI